MTGEVVEMSEGSLGKRRVGTRALAVLGAALVATGVTYGTAAAGEDSYFVKADDARFITGVTPFIGSAHTLFNFDATKKHGHVDGFASFEVQPFNGPAALPVSQTPLTHIQGKVTCLDVQGKKAGFLYTADVGSGAAFIGQVVRGTIEDNGPGKADRIVVNPPVPAAVAGSDCAPQATTNNLSQGNAKVGRGGGEDKDGIDPSDY
jgi:hypothetical protein